MAQERYAFWNNKGGTGKTSLAFQGICQYADKHKDKKILVIDVCPQGNLSELFLGGLMGKGSATLLELQKSTARKTVGGYFEARLLSPYTPINGLEHKRFIVRPFEENDQIPDNIDLLSGDSVLEVQSSAISSLSTQQIPGTNAWLSVVDWLNDFIDGTGEVYSVVFFDLNPSFSMYTQIALAATKKVVVPVMADDSSRRAILNAFSLIYGVGIGLDSDNYRSNYESYAFNFRLTRNDNGRELPKIHLLAKNRITQYMGDASAYASVLSKIEEEVEEFRTKYPEHFSENFQNFRISDFNTAGVVAFARGMPFFKMKRGAKTYKVGERRVQVHAKQRDDRVSNILEFSELF